mgnify:CR=1 FL=1
MHKLLVLQSLWTMQGLRYGEEQSLEATIARIAASGFDGIGSLWIDPADAKRVAAAYAGLTAACNECHVYMEHPFIVIKVPEDGGTDAFADQDFQPHP